MGPLSVANQVLTIHDLSVLDHPEWFHPLFARWYRTVLPLLAQRVRQVLTVSEYSRQQISRVFDLSPEKVLAIPGGVDLQHFRPATEAEMERIHQRYSLAGDYVLFVGTLEPRKNLSTLLDAWQLVWPEFPHLELVIAGSPAPNFAPASLVPNSPGVRFLGYVPDGDLPALYSGARAYLLPSLQEGFGLTVLEAMACGTPVIASSAGALPETAGVAGMLVDPLEMSSWAEALYRLLIDRNRWLWFRQAGFERVREFSWQKTAERVWQALEYAA
jgi:glycosyltransferase involved in cell wall biosynthesis